MLSRDFAQAYTFAAPSFRAIVPANAYQNRFGSAVIWLGAEVVRVECPEAEKCNARLRLDFRSVPGRAGEKTSAHIDETWIKEDGQWWIHQTIKP